MYRLYHFLLLLILIPVCAHAQDASQTIPFRVGVSDVEPLVVQSEDDVYDGLAVQLWQAIAEDANLAYDYVNVSRDSAQLLLNAGQLDVYLASTPATGSENGTQHSPIYHTTHLAVAKPEGNSILNVVKSLFSAKFLKIILGLSVLLASIGLVIYLLERKENEDQFGGKPVEGIGAGFWWAGVTLTTIGYGDKAPVTLPGRVVAMLWMLIGLGVSASLTAAIVSLAAQGNKPLALPNDLLESTNYVVEGHDVTEYLTPQSIPYTEMEDIAKAFKRAEGSDKESVYVLGNEMELQYYISNNSSNYTVQPTRLAPNYFAIGYRNDLPQASQLSKSVEDVMFSKAWSNWLKEYVPQSNAQ